VYYKRKAKYHVDVFLPCYRSGKVQGVQIVRSVSLGALVLQSSFLLGNDGFHNAMRLHLSKAEKKRFLG
jgi:hypothetical protein